MGAEAGHAPVVEHEDEVGAADGRDALGDDDAGGVRERGEGAAQRGVRGEVEGGGAVVKQEQLGFAHEGAGDGEALALAAGEVPAAG